MALHIHLLDTSVASDNLGDEMIVEAIMSIIYARFPNIYYTNSSSHDGMGNFGRYRAAMADIVFLLGTNALSPTWIEPSASYFPVTEEDLQAIGGKVVLFGVGASQADIAVEPRQKEFLSRLLSKQYRHSVRDEAAAKILADCGMESIVTSCPTLWNLHAERGVITFPPRQCDTVCFSLTNTPSTPMEQDMDTVEMLYQYYKTDIEFIDFLHRRYRKLYFWPQQIEEIPNLNGLTDINTIEILAPNVRNYSDFLRTTDCDVIGTRLHGTIYGLRHGRRSIALAIDDHRARQIGEETGLPVIEREKICQQLDAMLSQPITMDFSAVDRAANEFLDQFASPSAPARETPPPAPQREDISFLPGGINIVT